MLFIIDASLLTYDIKKRFLFLSGIFWLLMQFSKFVSADVITAKKTSKSNSKLGNKTNKVSGYL